MTLRYMFVMGGWVQAAGGSEEQAAGLGAWLASRDLARLGEEVQAGGGTVRVRLDGKDLVLRHGVEFRSPGTGAGKEGSGLYAPQANGSA